MQRSSEHDEFITVGRITRTVGLEGFCTIDPLGTALQALIVPCKVRIGAQENDCELILLEELQSRPKNLVGRFEGLHDKDSADRLRGKNIYINKTDLPSLDQDEFYHFELIGMEAFTDERSDAIGIVSEVHNFPAADTVEIKPNYGDPFLIPLTGESIIRIEKDSRKIVFRHSFVEDLL
jgi:16S rRNA processing protein RimM